VIVGGFIKLLFKVDKSLNDFTPLQGFLALPGQKSMKTTTVAKKLVDFVVPSGKQFLKGPQSPPTF
jgi:hypothetical protein